MKVNIENCLRNALNCKEKEKSYYKFSIEEFIKNLKELRNRIKNGENYENSLDEFFDIYVFDDNKEKNK